MRSDWGFLPRVPGPPQAGAVGGVSTAVRRFIDEEITSCC